MKKMTLKSLALGALMLFAGWQSFAGTTDTVYALAGNKIALSIPTNGDTAIWVDAATGSTPTGTGLSFIGSMDSAMHIDGTTPGSIYAQGGTYADSTTSATVKQFIYHIQLKSAGGCISDDTSTIVVYLMPNLIIPVANADTGAKYCANNPISVTLNATMPTFTGMPSVVTAADFIWTKNGTATTTTISGAQNMTLTVTSPNTVTSDVYKAETKYNLPSGHNLVVSLTGGGSNAFSGTVNVTATAAPTAPTLSGGTTGSGF